MSTYEALAVSLESLEIEFRELSDEAAKLRKIADLVYGLIDLEAAEVEPRYQLRLSSGGRRLSELGGMIKSALVDADGYLRESCKLSYVSEAATLLGQVPLRTQSDKQEEEKRGLAEVELAGARELIGIMRRVLADSGIPKLLVS